MPTWAASSVYSPICTPWAICTRLSIFVPAPDPRLPHCRPIDRRIRPDLHVVFDDDVALLRDLVMNALVVGDEAEPVTANHRSVLHDDARADDRAVANRDAGVEDRVVADLRFGADDDVRVEDDAIADHGLRADDHERADRDVAADARVRRDDGGRVHAGGRPLVAPEQREGLGERAVRMRGAQHRARCRRGILGQDDGRGTGLPERPVRSAGWPGTSGRPDRPAPGRRRGGCRSRHRPRGGSAAGRPGREASRIGDYSSVDQATRSKNRVRCSSCSEAAT